MSTLGDLLLPSAIIPRARWQGRKQVLQELSATMAQALNLDPNDPAILRQKRFADTYTQRPQDLLFRIYVKYLPYR